MSKPILRTHTDATSRFVVYACLSKHKANSLPYFSVTADEYLDSMCITGGCLHEEMLAIYPDLEDLVKMHLSDINGMPMHAVENGFYWIAGCFPDGLGQRYHGGNDRTAANCRDLAMEHFRINMETLDKLLSEVENNKTNAKRIVATFVESQKSRWLSEANEVIEKYNLKIVEM